MRISARFTLLVVWNKLLDEVDLIHCCTIASAQEAIAIAALKRNKFVIVEKSFTGFFGDRSGDFNGDTFPKQRALEQAMASIKRILEAEKKSKGKIFYAETYGYWKFSGGGSMIGKDCHPLKLMK